MLKVHLHVSHIRKKSLMFRVNFELSETSLCFLHEYTTSFSKYYIYVLTVAMNNMDQPYSQSIISLFTMLPQLDVDDN